ncbi:lamin-A-like, partial [Stegastes partitus]|uniref:Lamin-A-like n=1 Tax=Stegastes partitus TaxID=144197 RepID=A0A9Y4NNA3_9TELE
EQKKDGDLENALAHGRYLEAALNSKAAAHTKLLSETKRLNNKITDLQSQLEKKIGHCQELERTLDREREGWQQKCSQKEQEQQKMRSQLQEYQDLLGDQLALDVEINTYRKMLEVEEQRLMLCPSPSQHNGLPQSR